MSKFKEELAHHIEYCEIFSHHIMFICAFTAWVRSPSILFTFILKRCHAFIISVIVVTRRSIIFIEHFLSYLITVNHSRTNFLLCPTGSQHVMSKWAHFHIWAMRLTRLSNWFITACHGGREAGSNVSTCCDILGPFFGIFDKSVWIRASLTLVSLLLYNKHVSCSNLQQAEPAVPSRLDAQKHLDDLLHSAGKASPLLSGRGLSYNHSQRTHGRLLELDIPKIVMGTAVIFNNLWSILNNTTANIDFALTRCPNFLAGWLIFMHLEFFLSLALSFMATSQRWWAWWRKTRIHRHHLHEPGTKLGFVMTSLPDLRTHLRF